MLKYNKIIISICLILLLGTAFVTSNKLISNEAARTFYVEFVSVITIIFISINFIARKKPFLLKLNILDILILGYVAYSIIRLFFTPYVPIINDRIIVLVFLTLFYFCIKFVSLKPNLKSITPISILIISFFIIGTLQAIIGIFQAHNLFGFYSHYFLTTGTFGNPSYYSGFLTPIFPLAFGLYIFTEPKSLNEKIIKYTSLICFLSILFALPLTKIRGDWVAILIATVFILFYKYNLKKYFHSFTKKFVLVIVSFILVLSLFYGLYNIRPDSAFGRLLIWKVSSEMVKENPVFGIGFGRYSQVYNNYQANYFAEKERTEYEKYVADNVRHAHNEYIQHFAELGIVGLLLLIAIIYTSIFKSKIIINKNYSPSVQSGFLIPLKAAAIAISISAFFAFPFQIISNQINFILLLGIISALGFKHNITTSSINVRAAKIIGALGLIITSWFTVELYEKFEANKKWGIAYYFSSIRIYENAIENYESIYSVLQHDPEYLLNYGGTLSLAGRNTEAIDILEKCKKKSSASNLYILLANSYKELKNFKLAEINYLHASTILPSRLYPKYLLAKLYKVSNDEVKFSRIAFDIINSDAKFHSIAEKQIKNEIKSLLK
ncbi:MAG: hypothetical protein HND52_06090 [Ignavibacteriae bacterium]|nr:hypothetical protein [Ignavibacteriota bacterium]NOG97514.1 hypothetical protein [Ignavibacteriota bacterium]